MSPISGEPHASLTVDSELRELARVNAWVHDWAERQRLSARIARNLDLCSTEVVTNIMNHARGDGARHIVLRLGWQGQEVALEVEDEGTRFDPIQVPQPPQATSLQDARIGGWGIPIVRRFSDGLRYRREDGRNCLTLLFQTTTEESFMGSAGKTQVIDTQAALAAQAALASQSQPNGGEASGVDKMRELLFGNQMQDYDKRFSILEERFQQRLRDLEAESSRSLSNLEGTMKKQLESVAGQFREEKDLRADADKELDRSLRDHTQALEKRLAQVSDQLARQERDFTDRLGHEVQSLREDIRRRQDDSRATIERMFSELSNVKTDRNLLAGLFVEIAKCLNQDVSPKGGNSERG